MTIPQEGQETLLPCPFCGNDVDGVLDVNEGVAFTPWYVVACNRCDFNVSGAREIPDAIAKWNQRAPVVSSSATARLSPSWTQADEDHLNHLAECRDPEWMGELATRVKSYMRELESRTQWHPIAMSNAVSTTNAAPRFGCFENAHVFTIGSSPKCQCGAVDLNGGTMIPCATPSSGSVSGRRLSIHRGGEQCLVRRVRTSSCSTRACRASTPTR